VGRHGVELVGGHDDGHARAVEVRQQVEHLVAGLMSTPLVGSSSSAPGRRSGGREDAVAGRRRAAGHAVTMPPTPSRSSTRSASAVVASAEAPRRTTQRPMSTTSHRRGEVPVHRLQLRHQPTLDVRLHDPTVHRDAASQLRDAAHHRPQQRGLARWGPPRHQRRARSKRHVLQDRRAAVTGADSKRTSASGVSRRLARPGAAGVDRLASRIRCPPRACPRDRGSRHPGHPS
jgi:hypothetical protein